MAPAYGVRDWSLFTQRLLRQVYRARPTDLPLPRKFRLRFAQAPTKYPPAGADRTLGRCARFFEYRR
jgi:hypothetical protein